VTKRWLLSGITCRIVTLLNLRDKEGLDYCDQAWLSEATGVVDGARGNAN
jgi:hypothetical protein